MKNNILKNEYAQQLKLVMIYVLVFSTIFFLLYKTLPYTLPFLIAFILAWILQPGIRFLKNKFRFKPTLAALFMTVLFFASIFGLLTWLIIELVKEATLLVSQVDLGQISFITSPVQDILQRIGQWISQIDIDLLQEYESQIMSMAQASLQVIEKLGQALLLTLVALPVWLTMFFVIIFSTFFLSRDLSGMQKSIQKVFSKQFLDDFHAAWIAGLGMLGRYIRSYLIVYSLTFLQTLIFFSVLRIRFALLLSLAAGIADVLPIFGIGFIYWPLAAYLLINGQTVLGIAVIIGYVVVTAIRQFVEPKLVADSIEIHPVLVLAIFFIGLRAQSLMLIIYLVLMLMVYQMLKKAGLLQIVKKQVTNPKPQDSDHQI